MLNLPIYNNKKLKLSFEYGLILAKTAQDLKIELTPEIIKRAEEVIINEFKTRNSTQLACDMVPVLLAIFETN